MRMCLHPCFSSPLTSSGHEAVDLWAKSNHRSISKFILCSTSRHVSRNSRNCLDHDMMSSCKTNKSETNLYGWQEWRLTQVHWVMCHQHGCTVCSKPGRPWKPGTASSSVRTFHILGRVSVCSMLAISTHPGQWQTKHFCITKEKDVRIVPQHRRQLCKTQNQVFAKWKWQNKTSVSLVVVCVAVQSGTIPAQNVLQFPVRQILSFWGSYNHKSVLTRIHPFKGSSAKFINTVKSNFTEYLLFLSSQIFPPSCRSDSRLDFVTHFAFVPIQYRRPFSS